MVRSQRARAKRMHKELVNLASLRVSREPTLVEDFTEPMPRTLVTFRAEPSAGEWRPQELKPKVLTRPTKLGRVVLSYGDPSAKLPYLRIPNSDHSQILRSETRLQYLSLGVGITPFRSRTRENEPSEVRPETISAKDEGYKKQGPQTLTRPTTRPSHGPSCLLS